MRADDLWRFVASEANHTRAQFADDARLSALSDAFFSEWAAINDARLLESVMMGNDTLLDMMMMPMMAEAQWLESATADSGAVFSVDACGFYRCYFDGARRLVLNVSSLSSASSSSEAFLDVPVVAVSADERRLAYLVDRVGDERYELRVRDLASLVDSPPLAVCHQNLFWLGARNAVACTALDDVYAQPLLVWLVELGDDDGGGGGGGSARTSLLFNQTNAEFAVQLVAADSGAVLIVASQGQVTSDVRFVLLDDASGALHVLHAAQRDVQLWPLHVALGERASAPAFAWLARTNWPDAPNYRIVAAKSDLARPDAPVEWLEVLAHDNETLLLDMTWLPRSASLVVVRLRHMEVEVCVTQIDARFDGADDWSIAVGALACATPTVGGGRHGAQHVELKSSISSLRTTRARPALVQPYDGCFDSFAVRAQSLVDAPATFAVLVCANGTLRVVPTVRESYAARFDSAEFETERVFVGDAGVPLTLAHRRGVRERGGGAVFLTGYGAYGSTLFPAFHTQLAALMLRNWTVALCHVRGSAARGTAWYHDGRRERKQNSFDDVARCADWLVQHNVAQTPQHIALFGRSAGGLLMASSALQWPHKFGAVLLQAPFVDVLATMTDALAPWTVFEWQEWGDPFLDDGIAALMQRYSPVALAQAAVGNSACLALPLMLQTGLSDAIVRYYEHARLFALLRQCVCEAPQLLLQVTDSGHVGNSGDSHMRDVSQQMAFLIDRIEGRARGPPALSSFVALALGVAACCVATLAYASLRCRKQRPNAIKV